MIYPIPDPQVLDLARFAQRPGTLIAARLAWGSPDAVEQSWEGAASGASAGDVDAHGGTMTSI